MANLIEGWNGTTRPDVTLLVEGGKPVRVSVTGDAFMRQAPGMLEPEFDHVECGKFLATYGVRADHESWDGAEFEDESVCALKPLEASTQRNEGESLCLTCGRPYRQHNTGDCRDFTRA